MTGTQLDDALGHLASFSRSAGVLRAQGDLDLAAVDDFRGQLEALAASGPGEFVVDLSGVTFMDSVALSALVRAHREADEHGSLLVVQSPSEVCSRLFELAGLVQLFTIRR